MNSMDSTNPTNSTDSRLWGLAYRYAAFAAGIVSEKEMSIIFLGILSAISCSENGPRGENIKTKNLLSEV